jgi:hypothetical protein
MSILKKLNQKFSQSADQVEIPVAVEPDAPCSCGSVLWWRPHGHSGWRCNACSPAPSRALIAELKDLSPHIISNELVTYCKPWCPHCGSWMARELVWSDWSTSIRCDVCEQEIPSKPNNAPIEHKQHAIVECDCDLPKQFKGLMDAHNSTPAFGSSLSFTHTS